MHSKITEEREPKILSRDGSYQIPTFNSIFTYYANPFDKQLSLMNEWMDWMFPFSLLPKGHYERRVREASIMTSSYLYPFCKDIKRFERLVKWMAYLFICDDHIELGRDKEITEQIINQAMDCIKRLEAIHVSDVVHNISLLGFKPYILCAYFVAEDILLDMKMEQRRRFIRVWRSYCLANNKENELIEIQLLDLDAISKVRIESGGMKTLFVLIEYSEKIHISDQMWWDDRIQRLMDLCNLCTIFVNDVYSFEKELLEQKNDMGKMIVNVVGFNVLRFKCSIVEAFERSLDIIREYEFEYKKLADSLVNDDNLSDECKRFVECVTAINAVATETSGVFGKDALKLIKAIGTKITEVTHEKKATSYLIQRLSIIIQRGNIASVLGTVPPSKSLSEIFYL